MVTRGDGERETQRIMDTPKGKMPCLPTEDHEGDGMGGSSYSVPSRRRYRSFGQFSVATSELP
jgi:hypothetical protein